MSQYYCWNCGLMQGDDTDPIEASRLCPACAAAMSAKDEEQDE
jgi:hypothetical protein